MSEDFAGAEHELVPGVLRGYRAWRWQEGRLIACNWDGTWEPGRNEARCLRYQGCGVPECASCAAYIHPEPVPYSPCACGFYAKHKPGGYDSRGSVIGVIKAYGKVVLGTLGFRAQYAEIEALSMVSHEIARTVNDYYQVPCFDYYQVPCFADYGEMLEKFPPIPVDELLPPKPKVHGLGIEDLIISSYSVPPSGWAVGPPVTLEMWNRMLQNFPNGQAPL